MITLPRKVSYINEQIRRINEQIEINDNRADKIANEIINLEQTLAKLRYELEQTCSFINYDKEMLKEMEAELQKSKLQEQLNIRTLHEVTE